MSRYAEPLARLIEELKKLPGVGTKSAQRFAFHILRSSDEDAAALAEANSKVRTLEDEVARLTPPAPVEVSRSDVLARCLKLDKPLDAYGR